VSDEKDGGRGEKGGGRDKRDERQRKDRVRDREKAG
jgi:hypothetical protein